MIIGLVGHPIKVDNIHKTLYQIDNSLEIKKLEFTELPLHGHLELFQKIQKTSDIVMIGGYFDYMFFSENSTFQKVTGYIPRDILTLYKTLLMAALQGFDIFNISLDGYCKENVIEVYEEIQMYTKENHVLTLLKESTLLADDLDRLVEFHINNYREKHVSVCITCISLIHEKLKLEGIPTLMVHSTFENIRLTYEKLRLEYLLKTKETNDIILLKIEVSDETRIPDDDCQSIQKKLRAAEKIFLFSQRLQAAIEEINLGRYVIMANKLIFERETNMYKRISLLDEMKSLDNYRISIGIGTGNSARDADKHAEAALLKARKHSTSCAYIVNDPITVAGPIVNSASDPTFNEKGENEHFLFVAAATCLSVNTIFKFNSIIEKYKSNVFTINELSLIYGISLRSMYRIIDKLELGGYIKEKGKKITDGSGRPSRIIEINI